MLLWLLPQWRAVFRIARRFGTAKHNVCFCISEAVRIGKAVQGSIRLPFR